MLQRKKSPGILGDNPLELKVLIRVVRKMDNAIHWINREPVDKYFQSNILDLSPCAILVY